MLKTSLIVGSVILATIYIAFGDQITFLPKEMKTASVQARTSIVNFGGKLIPGWVSKTKDKKNDAWDKQDPENQPAQ
ncbi:hypothetical protein [[Phormidium] sp. ETS-05]|uniref:hypothetical protein n=1 Tax=[Phormidium] sp. ETS-05 TaxID=222819 RepID=UPI0018EF30AF|nr:hypothetical protein [[Phormidium] sp. ETS-05]